MNESTARRALVRYCRAMHAAGWVANHDGNLSARAAPDRIVCTPTAMSKADVALDDLIVVDPSGRKIGGRRSVFSELNLHRAVYAARPSVHAVVHAHPPNATAFGVAGRPLPHPFLPEAVVSLGAHVPTVPLASPGAAAAKALEPFLKQCDAVLIAGNGVLAWGPDLETAYLRLELVEHLCRVAATAMPLGGVKLLPSDLISELVAKRASAGLAAPGEATPAVAPPNRNTVAAQAAARALRAMPNVDPAIAARIAEEIAARIR